MINAAHTVAFLIARVFGIRFFVSSFYLQFNAVPVEETKSKEQKGFFLPIKRTPLNYNENTFEGKDV